MRVRFLTNLPGHLGGLPEGESIEAGKEYEVGGDFAGTCVREGVAVPIEAAAQAQADEASPDEAPDRKPAKRG